jgi:hypothetical protein
MKYIFIWCVFLTLSCQNNQKVKQVKGGTITIQEYDTPASVVEMSLSEEDSLLYHEVVADYGNYWETTINNKKKYVVFDFYSGKILVYLDKKENSIINNEPSDYSFYWETDTINPYKIKGVYSEIEKDTLLFWNYNPQTKVLVDEIGLVFKRKKLKAKIKRLGL